MVGSGCNHFHRFAQHRLHQYRFVLVVCLTETELTLGAETTGVDVAFVGEDEGVFTSQSHLFYSGLFL